MSASTSNPRVFKPTSDTPADEASQTLVLPSVRRLDDIPRPSPDDEGELLCHRFLCRGGGALLVGPSGIGKSSLAMQMMVNWSLGCPAFGITPARPLKFLLVQAENDDGDLAEMRDGVIAGMGLFPCDRERVSDNLLVATEQIRTGFTFLEVVDALVETHRPDVLVLDPLFAYLGCDAVDQGEVSAFLRSGLNPLLTRHGCAALLVHHTNKPAGGSNRPNFQAGDFAYAGAGSAEFTNWARAVIVLRSLGRHDVFELRLGKRGARVGWKEADEETPRYVTQIAHAREQGQICWEELAGEEQIAVPAAGGRAGPVMLAQDVVALVPATGQILKDELVAKIQRLGVGVNPAKALVKAAIEAGDLLQVEIPRSGTRAQLAVTRPAGVEDPPVNVPEGNLPEEAQIDTHGAFIHP